MVFTKGSVYFLKQKDGVATLGTNYKPISLISNFVRSWTKLSVLSALMDGGWLLRALPVTSKAQHVNIAVGR